MYWYQELPLELRTRIRPRTKEKISPFEILYGRPYQMPYKGEGLTQVGNQYLRQHIIVSSKQLE